MPSRFVTNNHSVYYGTQRYSGTRLRAGYPQGAAAIHLHRGDVIVLYK